MVGNSNTSVSYSAYQPSGQLGSKLEHVIITFQKNEIPLFGRAVEVVGWQSIFIVILCTLKQQFVDETDEQGGGWIKECCEQLIFVNAIEQIERQKLQQGFYILFPNEITEYGDKNFCFNKKIKPIDKKDEQIKKVLAIKKEGKSEIRKKLDFLGISEATLFADNIDIICKNIVDQCKQRRV